MTEYIKFCITIVIPYISKSKIVALKFYESPFHATETPEVASKSVLKADLTIMIRDIMEEAGYTQKEFAEILGVSQPRISDIVNGKIDKLTLDALFSVLDKLGFKASFTFGSSEEASIQIQKVPVAA
ncbi:helix-turn-helix domain-containing protein [Nostoc sp.]